MLKYVEFKNIENKIDLTRYLNKDVSVSFSDILTNNTFTFDGKVVKCLKDNTKMSLFPIYFETNEIGDVFEIEVEVRSISGAYPKIYIHETRNIYSLSNTIEVAQTIATKTGEWELIKFNHIFVGYSEERNTKISVGLPTSEAGEFEFRNFKIRCLRDSNTKKEVLKIRPMTICKDGGVWSVREDTAKIDTPSIEVIDDTTVRINYGCLYDLKPVITLGNDYNSGWRHKCIIQSIQSGYADFKFVKTDGTYISIADIFQPCTINILVVGK